MIPRKRKDTGLITDYTQKTERLDCVYIGVPEMSNKSLLTIVKQYRMSWNKDDMFNKNSISVLKKEKMHFCSSMQYNVILREDEPCENLRELLSKNI